MKNGHAYGPREKGIIYKLIIIFSLAAVALVLVSTSRYGIGISPDSTVYLSTARNLLAGHGYQCFDGSPYTQCPPLFPTLLAGIGLAGLDPAAGARLLNALAFGGIILASGIFFSRCLGSKALTVIAISSVLLSPALLSVSIMAWTEPVFVLLIVLFVLQISEFLGRRRTWSLAVASVLAALCLLARYTGVVLMVAGAILILSPVSHTRLSKRLEQLGCFTVVTCTPLAVYCMRNYLLTRMFTGHARPHSIYTAWENVTAAADTATSWFVPSSIALPIRVIILVAVILSVALTLFLFHKWPAMGAGCDCPCLWPAGLVMLTYIPLMLYTHQVGVLDETMNDRYLAPILVLLLWFLFAGIDRLMALLSRIPGKPALVQHIVVALCGLWLIFYPLDRTHEVVRAAARYGAGGYSAAGRQESPTVKWLRVHPLPGPVRSNAPDALYALTGVSARVSPHRSWDLLKFREIISSGEGEYLVWFRGLPRYYLCSFEDLVAQLYIEEVAGFRDGGVYRLVPSTDCAFPNSRIFSGYMVNGVWNRRFTCDILGTRGTIPSWVLHADNTTDSTWRLPLPDGRIITWRPSCPYARSDGTFQFVCEGEAALEPDGTTSVYSLAVRGTIEGDDAATGTYRIEFANPQWPNTVSGTWRVDLARPVHRLYSPQSGVHFYTMSMDEGIERIRQSPGRWLDEGVAFCVYEPLRPPPDTRPVYQFRSRDRNAQFFTILEAEKDRLINGYAHAWDYQGVAFYAYEEGSAPPDAQPVHRFWSQTSQSHLYTISEYERRKLADDPSRRWAYEGIAWYALAEDSPETWQEP